MDISKQVNWKYVPRYKQKLNKKRQWDDNNAAIAEKRSKTDIPFERIKRKKSLVLLGYSGAQYFGMQRNPGMQTIEEELLRAMKKNDWITNEAYEQPQSIGFQRAARTDKGVSAYMQCVSLKLPENLNLQSINDDLPEQIRVFCVKRVTKGFNSKDQCDFRTYSYTLPTVAFAHHEDQVDIETYRLPSSKQIYINDILKLYTGTKNYHNFTSKKAPFDPSAKRFIVSFECKMPFLVRNKYEFATIEIKGQSFMIHQIRKMIGLSLAVIRGLTPETTINNAFKEEKLDLPTAPGLGLVLNQVHYDRYNNRYGSDGIHDKILFVDHQNEIESFAEKYILNTITETEIEQMCMKEWLQNLHRHTYEFREGDPENPSVC